MTSKHRFSVPQTTTCILRQKFGLTSSSDFKPRQNEDTKKNKKKQDLPISHLVLVVFLFTNLRNQNLVFCQSVK